MKARHLVIGYGLFFTKLNRRIWSLQSRNSLNASSVVIAYRLCDSDVSPSTVHLDGFVNKHSISVWAPETPYRVVATSLYAADCTVWCAATKCIDWNHFCRPHLQNPMLPSLSRVLDRFGISEEGHKDIFPAGWCVFTYNGCAECAVFCIFLTAF